MKPEGNSHHLLQSRRRLLPAAFATLLTLSLIASSALDRNGSPAQSRRKSVRMPGEGSRPVPGVPPLRRYEFETVTVDSNGAIVSRRKGRAMHYIERLGGVAVEMVEIPGGTFAMGSESNHDDEKPVHQVNIPAFYMGKYEVTQAQWRAVAMLPRVRRRLNPSPSDSRGRNLPVEQVSWDDAMEFCARLSRTTGRTYRLPTEAEWEYACRAGTTTPFAFGQNITPDLVNYDGAHPFGSVPARPQRGTVPVGSLGVANGFGLYDMLGNVEEWCLDNSHDNYNGAPADGSAWRIGDDSAYRVTRGGSWYHYAEVSRSTFRGGSEPNERSDHLGFRVAAVKGVPPREKPAAPVAAAEVPSTGPGGLPLSAFAFDIAAINSEGVITKRRKAHARYYVEDIGGVGLEMVHIPAGSFIMGSSDFRDASPMHHVGVPSFYLGKYEVTQAQWRAVAKLPKAERELKAEPSYFKGDSLPVEQVSWADAMEFCARLSQATGRTYRLPTEAEWEYTCRASSNTPFAFGDSITPAVVNYDGQYPYASAPIGKKRDRTTPVGSLGFANAFGLYDMHGNVWEWCADYWHNDFGSAPSDGSVWEIDGDDPYRVLRGGSYMDQAIYSRSASRQKGTGGDLNRGFRVAGGPEPPTTQPPPKPPAPRPPLPPGTIPPVPRGLALAAYDFDTLTLDSKGAIAERRKGQARYYVENINGVALEMVQVPSGSFAMGSSGQDHQEPVHQVNVPGFYIGKYEVTQEQWKAVAALPKIARDLRIDPSRFKGGDLPVDGVSWNEAMEFCARLSKATGTTYRLPSEAEWEYACRAGTTTDFSFGPTITSDVVNYQATWPFPSSPVGVYRGRPTPVGSLGVANGFGLYDMLGNVWEWCLDFWHENYNGAPSDGSAWVRGGDPSSRVWRGGSWSEPGAICTSAYRDKLTPGYWAGGLRVLSVAADR